MRQEQRFEKKIPLQAVVGIVLTVLVSYYLYYTARDEYTAVGPMYKKVSLVLELVLPLFRQPRLAATTLLVVAAAC